MSNGYYNSNPNKREESGSDDDEEMHPSRPPTPKYLQDRDKKGEANRRNSDLRKPTTSTATQSRSEDNAVNNLVSSRPIPIASTSRGNGGTEAGITGKNKSCNSKPRASTSSKHRCCFPFCNGGNNNQWEVLFTTGKSHGSKGNKPADGQDAKSKWKHYFPVGTNLNSRRKAAKEESEEARNETLTDHLVSLFSELGDVDKLLHNARVEHSFMGVRYKHSSNRDFSDSSSDSEGENDKRRKKTPAPGKMNKPKPQTSKPALSSPFGNKKKGKDDKPPTETAKSDSEEDGEIISDDIFTIPAKGKRAQSRLSDSEEDELERLGLKLSDTEDEHEDDRRRANNEDEQTRKEFATIQEEIDRLGLSLSESEEEDKKDADTKTKKTSEKLKKRNEKSKIKRISGGNIKKVGTNPFALPKTFRSNNTQGPGTGQNKKAGWAPMEIDGQKQTPGYSSKERSFNLGQTNFKGIINKPANNERKNPWLFNNEGQANHERETYQPNINGRLNYFHNNQHTSYNTMNKNEMMNLGNNGHTHSNGKYNFGPNLYRTPPNNGPTHNWGLPRVAYNESVTHGGNFYKKDNFQHQFANNQGFSNRMAYGNEISNRTLSSFGPYRNEGSNYGRYVNNNGRINQGPYAYAERQSRPVPNCTVTSASQIEFKPDFRQLQQSSGGWAYNNNGRHNIDRNNNQPGNSGLGNNRPFGVGPYKNEKSNCGPANNERFNRGPYNNNNEKVNCYERKKGNATRDTGPKGLNWQEKEQKRVQFQTGIVQQSHYKESKKNVESPREYDRGNGNNKQQQRFLHVSAPSPNILRSEEKANIKIPRPPRCFLVVESGAVTTETPVEERVPNMPSTRTVNGWSNEGHRNRGSHQPQYVKPTLPDNHPNPVLVKKWQSLNSGGRGNNKGESAFTGFTKKTPKLPPSLPKDNAAISPAYDVSRTRYNPGTNSPSQLTPRYGTASSTAVSQAGKHNSQHFSTVFGKGVSNTTGPTQPPDYKTLMLKESLRPSSYVMPIESIRVKLEKEQSEDNME